MKCPKCQHENRDGAKFCEECGEKLQSVCPKCGAELRPYAKFCDECGEKIGSTPTTTQETHIPKLEDLHTQLKSLSTEAQSIFSSDELASAENRPITALFADISGFTALSATQSSENIFQMVQNCFRELGGIIKTYDGIISGYRGDGFLALFGVPLHENDAERAILTGMEIREIMRKQNLEVSIGINTAMMTVGEIQSQLHSEYTAYGTGINLSARLQQSAKPSQILVGAGTYRLTRFVFDFEPTPPMQLKGFAEPVVAYEVKQMKTHPEKLRGIEGLRAQMIGREREFADLKLAVDELTEGNGSIVSIIGEAGIGKSRLVKELKIRFETRDLRHETKDTSNESQVSSLKSEVSCLFGRALCVNRADD